MVVSVLVTGARTGIGFELVKQLSSMENVLVIATNRNLSRATELSALAKERDNIKVLELDVNDCDSFKDFAKKVEEIVGKGGLNSVIHNAGILTVKKTIRIEEVSEKDLLDHFKTNTVGPILLSQALLPLLIKASENNVSKPVSWEKAALFFISSDLGSHKNNDKGEFWGYRESKAALNMSMQSMKIELAQFGIGTMSIHPGWVKTNMGGNEAPVSVEDSAKGIVQLLKEFSDKTNGGFKMFNGSNMPW